MNLRLFSHAHSRRADRLDMMALSSAAVIDFALPWVVSVCNVRCPRSTPACTHPQLAPAITHVFLSMSQCGRLPAITTQALLMETRRLIWDSELGHTWAPGQADLAQRGLPTFYQWLFQRSGLFSEYQQASFRYVHRLHPMMQEAPPSMAYVRARY